MAENKFFYVGQKAFIEKPGLNGAEGDGKVLILATHKYGLDFPGGRIQEDEAKEDNGESLMQALRREVKEETDLEIEIMEPFTVWCYNVPKSEHVTYLVGFKCKYVSGEVKLSNEHHDFHWVDKDSYKEFADDSDFTKALEKYFSL